jgi:hypothetical protein
MGFEVPAPLAVGLIVADRGEELLQLGHALHRMVAVASRAPIDPVRILKAILSVPALVPTSRSHFRKRSITVSLCPKRASICQRATNISALRLIRG